MKKICEAYDVVVAGGGMAGLSAAIAASREGAKTVLIQNRPVLGGNASSEIRMHICGADHHGTRPNARETGIIEEILLEHKYRNPENSYAIFDAILWEKAAFQENLTLRLNTHVTEVSAREGIIESVRAVSLVTEKEFCIRGKVFIDATGDAFVSSEAGASLMLGRESKAMYGEEHAAEEADSCTMGNSLMFKAVDKGHFVPFIKPFWAHTYTEEDMRFRDHSEISSGYWWIELGGGDLPVIEGGDEIRDELLKCVYGVWDHIKNGGDHGAENYELEWVGFLPGKRESRRVKGLYVLTEQDLMSAPRFEDTVAYGGWPMDVHTVEGFLHKNEKPNEVLLMDEVYTIPYRCFVSENIKNLMMAGRNISCTHLAFASARVMATCSVGGQAAGTAAAMAVQKKVYPFEILSCVRELQQRLLWQDCYLPGILFEPAGEDSSLFSVWKDAKAASSLGEGSNPRGLLDGNGRENPWTAEEGAEVKVSLSEAVRIQAVQILFDSNLSVQLMISLSEEQLRREPASTPPELVKDFELTLKRGGETVFHETVSGNYQRRFVREIEGGALCDEVVLKVLSTHGCTHPRVFALRLK